MTKVKFLRNVAIIFACLAVTIGAFAQPTSGTYTIQNNGEVITSITLTGDLTINVPSGYTAYIGTMTPGIQWVNIGTPTNPNLVQQEIVATFTKTGAGVLIITGNCTLNSTVTVSQGILRVGEGGATGTLGSNVTGVTVARGVGVNNAGHLYFNSSSDIVVSYPITVTGVGTADGDVRKYGSGSLKITSDCTPPMTVYEGTLQIGNGGTSGSWSSDITVAKDAVVKFFRTDNITYSGVISENSVIPAQRGGKVEQAGSGVLTFSGVHTYTGATTVSAGQLNIAAGGGSILQTSGINLSASTASIKFNNTTERDYTMPITGSGSLIKDGTGKLNLTGTLSYTGATTISAGTLSIRNTLASSNVVHNGNYLDLTIAEGETLTYNGVISGSGALVKWGAGSLILTAANTYTGATTVDNGILQIGNGGTTGTINNTSGVEVRSAGELVFNHTSATTFAKVISGAGKVTKKSYNTLKFTANNTYTGITTIEAGRLNIGGWTAAGSVAGNIVNNSYLTFERTNAYTYSGIISGSGNVESFGAALTLNGANTYTGETQITYAPTSIILGANGTIEQSSGVKFTAAGKFDISAGNKKIKNLNGSVAGAEVILGTRTLTIGNTNEADGGGAYSGKITGTAAGSTIALTKSGTGTLTLTGTSTYSGVTRINQGVVEFSALNNFGISTIDLYRSPKTLRWLSGNTADISSRIAAISDQAGATTTFDIGSNTVTFATALPTGTTVINKTGSGSLYITADNTRTSQLNVVQGDLYLGNESAAGAWAGNIDVASGTTLTFSRNNAVTYSGVISGSGTVMNANTGTSPLTLTGNNTFTGTLYVANDVIVGNGATAGSIATQSVKFWGINQTFSFNRSDDIIYSGAISDGVSTWAGNVIQQGAGKLTLNNVNTYKGGTVVTNGTLELGANGKIEESLGVVLGGTGKFRITSNKTIGVLATSANTEVKLDGGTLTLNDTTTQIAQELVAGIITGTGGIDKIGTLPIIFNGANTYTGGTLIAEGNLTLGANGIIANSEYVEMQNGTFDVSSGNKVVKNLHTSGSSTVNLGSATLQIGTGTTSEDGSGVFDGIFAGTNGNVIKTGAQSFSMYDGANTATGKFTLASGELIMSNNNWAGAFDLYSGATLEVGGTVNVSGAFAKLGGGNCNITMNLIGGNPSKLNIGGAFSAAGTGTFNISANAGNNQVLMEAASGLAAATMFDLNMPGFNATLVQGTNGARQTLLLNAAINDVTDPTIGTALAAGTATAVSVPLTWGAASDNLTLTANLRYFVYRSTSNNIGTLANCEANGTLLNAGGTVGITTYSATGLTPNTQYYFNVVVQDMAGNKAVYTAVNKTTAKADLGGTVTISGTAKFGETLTAVTTGLTSSPSVTLGALTYQWKRGNTNIGINSATYTPVQADITNTITVVVTAANTNGSVQSAATANIVKADKAAPAAPTLANKTHNSITLNAVAGCEYRIMDEITYVHEQTGTAFTGLTPERTYHLYQRYAETATHNASDYNTYPGLTVVTNVAPAITTFEISPASVTVQKGQTQQFTANVVAVGGASTAVTWTIVGAHHANTTISTSGLLTVAAAETANSLQVKITSNFESALTATAQVTLTAAPAVTNVSVSADASEVMKGQTLQFTANVTAAGGASEAVTWTIVGTHHASTTVSTSGLLSVATAETAATLTVKATSQFNTAVAGQLTVNVLDIPAVTSVSVTPSPVSVQKGTTQNFTAQVTAVGGASAAVTWTVEGGAASSITTGGVLTVGAGETAQTLTVRATSQFNIAVSGTATVTVTDIPVTPEVLSVTISPSDISLQQGQNTTFTANVEAVGGASEAVTWTVEGGTASSIDMQGLLFVGAGETATTLIIRATSDFNGISGTATVTVVETPTPPEVIDVTVEPQITDVMKGHNAIFTAEVTVVGSPAPSTDVLWSVTGNLSANTYINEAGELSVSADEEAIQLTVIATSVADPSKKGSAVVMVIGDPDEITEIENFKIVLYPNPVVDELYIANYELRNGENVEIYDMNGKLVLSSISTSINVSNLKQAMYFVKVGNNIAKIIKK